MGCERHARNVTQLAVGGAARAAEPHDRERAGQAFADAAVPAGACAGVWLCVAAREMLSAHRGAGREGTPVRLVGVCDDWSVHCSLLEAYTGSYSYWYLAGCQKQRA